MISDLMISKVFSNLQESMILCLPGFVRHYIWKLFPHHLTTPHPHPHPLLSFFVWGFVWFALFCCCFIWDFCVWGVFFWCWCVCFVGVCVCGAVFGFSVCVFHFGKQQRHGILKSHLSWARSLCNGSLWSSLNSDPLLHEVIVLISSGLWSALMWAAIFLWAQPRDKLVALDSMVVKHECKQSGDLLCARWDHFQVSPQTHRKWICLVYCKYKMVPKETVFQAQQCLLLASSEASTLWFQPEQIRQ